MSRVEELSVTEADLAVATAAAGRAGEALRDMLTIVAIESPTFHETERGGWLLDRWREIGLDAGRDEVGNVIGRYGSGDAEPVVVAAHLDTVFPAGTSLDVRRDGDRYLAPGIADNARGLAVMLAVARTFAALRVQLRRPVLFVGSVGEEGAGDLRGVKHLFRGDGGLLGAHAFLALDGSGLRRVVHRGVGARRFRCTVRGPGGHSWANRGRANALHAAADAMSAIARAALPSTPSALTVARAGGGISINAIPAEAWFEVDARSEAPDVVASLERVVRAAVAEAVASVPELEAQIEQIGDRPAGSTPADCGLIAAVRAATAAVGEEPELVASSTDANVPMACGIPAVAIGGGGDSGGTHTLGEWYSDGDGERGIARAALAILLAAAWPPA